MPQHRCYYFLSHSCWTIPWVSLPCHHCCICSIVAARSPHQRLVALGIRGDYVAGPVWTPGVFLCVDPASGPHSTAWKLWGTKFLWWEPAVEHLNGHKFLEAAMVVFTPDRRIINICRMRIKNYICMCIIVPILLVVHIKRYLFAAETTGGLGRGIKSLP